MCNREMRKKAERSSTHEAGRKRTRDAVAVAVAVTGIGVQMQQRHVMQGWQGCVQQLGAWAGSAPELTAQLKQDHPDSERQDTGDEQFTFWFKYCQQTSVFHAVAGGYADVCGPCFLWRLFRSVFHATIVGMSVFHAAYMCCEQGCFFCSGIDDYSLRIENDRH